MAHPIAQNFLDQRDLSIIALGVYLLAQEVYKPIVTEEKLVHLRAGIADLTLGTDLAKEDRELPEKLLTLHKDIFQIRV